MDLLMCLHVLVLSQPSITLPIQHIAFRPLVPHFTSTSTYCMPLWMPRNNVLISRKRCCTKGEVGLVLFAMYSCHLNPLSCSQYNISLSGDYFGISP
ncbi:hypothetical protein B0H34DRAFT_689824 [Crassisporium funariophilum]|nr:hypothetical protein B0H34DRAFT_689824 [Crassisporium funariophilum]